MSLLGVDVGTTGAKAVVFDSSGQVLGSAYVEYDIARLHPGHAELDAVAIWPQICSTIAAAIDSANKTHNDPVQALAIDSMGENLVPVSSERRIVGPSITNMDERGSEYMSVISDAINPEELYNITGNTLSNQFSIGKIMWLAKNQPELYEKVDHFLPWNSFVSFMLGAEPVAEYALANRTLLFDLDRTDWSDRMLRISGIDRDKLARPVPAGTAIGEVSREASESTGLDPGIPIIIGAHDQPSASLGSGSISEGTAMYGLGTFHTIAPAFGNRKPARPMISLGLSTEHHSSPELFLTLIYNSGGAAVKWFRDTIAGRNASYDELFAEMPERPSRVRVIPHFGPMGPPDYVDTASATVLGMSAGTTRGDILRGIVEGNVYSLRMTTDRLAEVGIGITELRPTGGGSKSDALVQTATDILGVPCVKPEVTEASALGCAILAGVGSGVFANLSEAVGRLAKPGRKFEPNRELRSLYDDAHGEYLRLRELAVAMRAP